MRWCESLGKQTGAQHVRLERYAELPEPGRKLVRGWWNRADTQADSSFESFIYTWVAFNAWGECVSGIENDREWLRAVASHPETRRRTEEAMAIPEVAAACRAFHGMWPVFRLRDLRAAGVAHITEKDRTSLVARYRAAGAKPAAPPCWATHDRDDIPLDWPHLLFTAYRVRNNLFHGTKVVDSEMDDVLVAAAANALRAVVNRAGLL